MKYPKRLIEIDLPIKRISAHARREKSIRHGHISTLHIWWARRPLASCRAVICASLWPDPADPICPQSFRDAASGLITEFAEKVFRTTSYHPAISPESFGQWEGIVKAKEEGLTFDSHDPAHLNKLRFALLDFIADFANWDNSTVPAYLETSRALTQAAHEALGGAPGTRPLVVDPFAGGGSIPLEALRVGADTFASDLNPIPVLLNRVVLEFIPKYGQRLADEVRKWGEWIKKEAEKELIQFYPRDVDGATPIAYLWARTIRCEGAGCGVEVPLIRSLWVAKTGSRSIALKLVPNSKARRVDLDLVQVVKSKEVGDGTVKRGSVTCPVCGFTTPVTSVRKQLKERRGGASDARMTCVTTSRLGNQERLYRAANRSDDDAVKRAKAEIETRIQSHTGSLSLIPDELLDFRGIRHTWAMIYGLESWGDYFTPRQSLALSAMSHLIREAGARLAAETGQDFALAAAVQTCLAFSLSKCCDYWSCISTWMPRGTVRNTFARQAIPFTWDYAEANPIVDFHCSWGEAYQWVEEVCRTEALSKSQHGQSASSSAVAIPLPNDLADAWITDPPYYDAVPYSYLSDFFYVWLRRSLGSIHPDLFRTQHVPKDEEIIVDRPHELSSSEKNIEFYERELTRAFAEGRRVLRPGGIGTIVFASKTTASWEAILKAVVDAGWIITGSWPIDTEREARVSAQGQARLGSSIHLVCRPRENPDGSARTDEIGDWRDILTELPKRIHEWMPRLADEGVVGADAIFACLGPALEIFSRNSRVEKSNGDIVPLREYLEHVWAAVSNEALTMIFKDADAAGLEPDARLTAMWLWTLGTSDSDTDEVHAAECDADTEEQEGEKLSKVSGFVLEFDAARKIAQGLGIHLEKSPSIVEVKGDKARLLPVAERTKYLFGRETADAPTTKKRPKKKDTQLSFFEVLKEVDADVGAAGPELKAPKSGLTVLDRVHQAMILFAAGRSEALKSFVVDEGIGKDARFWKLAQSLSALYPPGIDEKRWVDGVLARKKGLGF